MSGHARCRVSRIAVLAASASFVFGLATAAGLPDDDRYDWQKEIFVPMRDGKNLSTDVILPRGAKGEIPTVLVRTPYDKERTEWVFMGDLYRSLVDHGYALVLQSERGREFSEGSYDNYLQGARTDGVDSADWIVKQSWSNGKIGTIGCSSSGEQEWPMASNNHPAHAQIGKSDRPRVPAIHSSTWHDVGVGESTLEAACLLRDAAGPRLKG